MRLQKSLCCMKNVADPQEMAPGVEMSADIVYRNGRKVLSVLLLTYDPQDTTDIGRFHEVQFPEEVFK